MNNSIKKGIVTLGAISSMLVGGDISNVSSSMYSVNIPVKDENIVLSQTDTTVEAKMPWKGEDGLTISYDLKPSIKERLLDSKLKRELTTNIVDNGNGFKIDILLFDKPDTNKFCYQIKGWENYNFEWQPPLTMEQEDGETCTDTQCINKNSQITKTRPEEIVGSYAIYSKTKKDHIVGKTDYETGKLGHIPYPYIWEIGKEDKKIRAEDFNFKDGELCVTVQQDFLDNADYTNGVRIDPTFGYTTTGASFVLVTANQWYGAKCVPTYSGSITSITTYTSRPSGGTTNWKGVVTNNSLGILTNGVSSSGTLTLTTPSWRTATYSTSPSVTSGSTYYCGIIPDQNFNQYYDTTGASSGDSKNDTSNSYTTPTDPTDASNLTRLQSTYVTYTISNWYDVSWGYRKEITIDRNKISTTTSSETYSNFPMLFDVTDTDLKYTGSGGNVGKSDGTDILFTSADGTTKLNHEIEYYASTTGRLTAWVNLSTNLSSTTDTTIYMYYGNSGASDQQNITGVWESNYKGVWHFANGTTLSGNDSTSNANNGSITGATATSTNIDGGAGFSSGNVITASHSTSLNFTGNLTMQNWIYPTSNGNYGTLIDRSDSGITRPYSYFMVGNNLSAIYLAIGGSVQGAVTLSSAITLNAWNYLSVTADGTNIKVYLNGNLVNTTANSSVATSNSNAPVYIGYDTPSSGNPFIGKMSEARVANTARTASWIKTEYNNQNATSTFYAISTQQVSSGGGGSVLEDAFDDFFLVF